MRQGPGKACWEQWEALVNLCQFHGGTYTTPTFIQLCRWAQSHAVPMHITLRCTDLDQGAGALRGIASPCMQQLLGCALNTWNSVVPSSSAFSRTSPVVFELVRWFVGERVGGSRHAPARATRQTGGVRNHRQYETRVPSCSFHRTLEKGIQGAECREE